MYYKFQFTVLYVSKIFLLLWLNWNDQLCVILGKFGETLHTVMTCAAVKWWQHKSDGSCSLLPDLITVELLCKSVLAVPCPLLKQCRPMWSLLRSDLRDKTFHTKIYSMVCWRKEGSKNVMLHPSIQGKRKDTFNLGKRMKFLIVSVTF